ncbi:hypothetical protein T4D_9469 [Trichinella pseudospiralis]|uniref:Uncharacterized protein n=1 Tax=Trichinella pseudospiralis TaxID=6337 RepID=A0A0V1F724_TRIPS|nr:hypothetical protein T4D_9469 [Trichinella pseudospiralis]
MKRVILCRTLTDYFKTVSTPTRSSWFETATRNHCELVSMKF